MHLECILAANDETKKQTEMAVQLRFGKPNAAELCQIRIVLLVCDAALCGVVHSVSLLYRLYHFVSNAICCLLAGGVVGIIIRYGLDAEKHVFLDCWHNKSEINNSKLPSAVIVNFSNTEFYEYSDPKKIDNYKEYVAQPQFEDKVLVDRVFSILCATEYMYSCATCTLSDYRMVTV